MTRSEDARQPVVVDTCVLINLSLIKLLVLAIRRGHITIEEADEAKAILTKHRFVMSYESFRERVKP